MVTEVNKHIIKNGFIDYGHYKAHYYKDLLIGYETFNSDLNWKSHYINGKEIGCTKFKNKQYYYNKSGKKFGEEIEWK